MYLKKILLADFPENHDSCFKEPTKLKTKAIYSFTLL